MQAIADILAAWPSDAELGRDVGVPYSTVSAWKQRGSIPAAYWWAITEAARRRGHPEITAELLSRLHARGQAAASVAALEQGPGMAEEGKPFLAAPSAGPSRASHGDETTPGQFSRWKRLRRSHFASAAEIGSHVEALREEWARR
jgi:hypothetical protein